jgi:hypothetical protein
MSCVNTSQFMLPAVNTRTRTLQVRRTELSPHQHSLSSVVHVSLTFCRECTSLYLYLDDYSCILVSEAISNVANFDCPFTIKYFLLLAFGTCSIPPIWKKKNGCCFRGGQGRGWECSQSHSRTGSVRATAAYGVRSHPLWRPWFWFVYDPQESKFLTQHTRYTHSDRAVTASRSAL